MRTARYLLALLLVVGLLSAPAGADDAQTTDPAGDNLHGNTAAILDIASAWHEHADTEYEDFLIHGVTTYGAWDESVLPKVTEGSQGRIWFVFEVNGTELRLDLLRDEDDDLYGILVDGFGTRLRKVIGYTLVRRVDDRSAEVEFPVSYFDRVVDGPLRSYSWRVETVDTRCSYPTSFDTFAYCDDQAPDGREGISHTIAQCEDGVDNDRDSRLDMDDQTCVWPGQLRENRASVRNGLTGRYLPRQGLVRGRVFNKSTIDAATGERYEPRFDDCLAYRGLTFTLIGRTREVVNVTTDFDGRWSLPLERPRPERVLVRMTPVQEIGIASTPDDDSTTCTGARLVMTLR